MVKSGLDPRQNSDSEIPRVSQYRLVAHLGMAYILYTVYLWCGLSHVFTPSDARVLYIFFFLCLTGPLFSTQESQELASFVEWCMVQRR